MSEQQSSYRQIFKATSIFGGVQVFNIIIGIIRSKAAAVFLGPAGVGILGLFVSTIDLIRSLTGLGLNTSAVREISYALGQDEKEKVAGTVTTVRKLCWICGIISLICVIILSPRLSQWTFNNSDYTLSFVFLSLVPFFQIISFGQLAVLQGLRYVTYLAKANLFGGLSGLFFAVPLYYFFGQRGIVPSLILAAFLSLCFSWFFSHKIQVKNIIMTAKQVYLSGLSMIKLGIMLTVSAFLVTLVNYFVRVYISHKGGIEDVGLYTAAITIITSYIGVVFTAMGTDFFPRLSSVSNDNGKMSRLINQQAEIGVLILTPMLILFMAFAPFMLKLFYSEKFILVSEMMRWSMLGVLLQASSWPLAYSLLAKANNKIYLLKEIGSCIYYLIFSIAGYNIWGLTGLGAGFVVVYIFNLIQNIIINKYLYNIKLSINYFKVLIPNLVLAIIAFLVISFLKNPIVGNSVMVLILCYSVYLSYKGIDERIALRSIIREKFKF